jgi:hypothetical protein
MYAARIDKIKQVSAFLRKAEIITASVAGLMFGRASDLRELGAKLYPLPVSSTLAVGVMPNPSGSCSFDDDASDGGEIEPEAPTAYEAAPSQPVSKAATTQERKIYELELRLRLLEAAAARPQSEVPHQAAEPELLAPHYGGVPADSVEAVLVTTDSLQAMQQTQQLNAAMKLQEEQMEKEAAALQQSEIPHSGADLDLVEWWVPDALAPAAQDLLIDAEIELLFNDMSKAANS